MSTGVPATSPLEEEILDEEALLLLVRHGVSAVAARERTSVRTLRRICARRGLSLAEYRVAAKRELARRLLAAGMPVKEVAARLGFASSQTFARFVRREFGMTATRIQELRPAPCDIFVTSIK
jgi:AraC-like DNA-binding protein